MSDIKLYRVGSGKVDELAAKRLNWQPFTPAERRRFADWCQLWAKRAEPRAQAPKSGVLLDLQDRQRDV